MGNEVTDVLDRSTAEAVNIPAGPTPGQLEAIDRFGKKDRHILTDDIPWVQYVAPGMYFKPLRFDTANNRVDIILDVRHPSVLGRHQHHGEVIAYTLEGSWYYREYDWVAKPGDRVHEAPGGIHTLVADGEKGMKTLFSIHGPIDFYGDDDSFGGTQSVFWWVDTYLAQSARSCDFGQVEERTLNA